VRFAPDANEARRHSVFERRDHFKRIERAIQCRTERELVTIIPVASG
jgi:hypothetical protein